MNIVKREVDREREKQEMLDERGECRRGGRSRKEEEGSELRDEGGRGRESG